MPWYEYKCRKCGHSFEERQRITDPKLTKCPKCGGEMVRLFSKGVSLKFNGSGFYSTDYK